MQGTSENTVESIISTGEEAKSPKILMAEDNLVNQKLANLLFKKINQSIDMVSNGREAVDAVLEGAYNLVFMDIQMPILDGVEASQEIKSRMGDKAPVIVALTANAMEGDKEKYLSSGMDHYLAKPISLKDLSEFIQQYVIE